MSTPTYIAAIELLERTAEEIRQGERPQDDMPPAELVEAAAVLRRVATITAEIVGMTVVPDADAPLYRVPLDPAAPDEWEGAPE